MILLLLLMMMMMPPPSLLLLLLLFWWWRISDDWYRSIRFLRFVVAIVSTNKHVSKSKQPSSSIPSFLNSVRTMTCLCDRSHCFPFTCLSFMFHLLFFSFLLHIRRRRPGGRRTMLATAFCFERADRALSSTRRLLLHPITNGQSDGARLAAASFFDRGTIADRRWWIGRFLLFPSFSPEIYVRAIDRTWARLAAASYYERATNCGSFTCCCIQFRACHVDYRFRRRTYFFLFNIYVSNSLSVLLHFASLLASPARSFYHYTSNQSILLSILFSLFTNNRFLLLVPLCTNKRLTNNRFFLHCSSLFIPSSFRVFFLFYRFSLFLTPFHHYWHCNLL